MLPNGIACRGRQDSRGVEEVVEVAPARQELEIAAVVGLVAVGIRLRPRVALEHERRLGKVTRDLRECPPAKLAVVHVDERVFPVCDHERGVVEAVLIRRNPHSRRERHHPCMRELVHGFEAETSDLPRHDVDAEPGDEDVRASVDSAQTRVVQMVEMMVRNVHVVGREELRRRIG